MNILKGRSTEEKLNTLTHFVGVLFTLSMAWLILKLSYEANWKHAFGVTFFTCGMLIMYACSTLYHWWKPGKGKQVLRLLDHIGIYIMIASSYTPICIGVVGGALGWIVFGLLWAVAIGGTFYKIFLIGRYPRLSLILYLLMGWSVVLIGKPVFEALPISAMLCILAEGIFYTTGTYFYAHDKQKYFHAIWHIFVLLGSIAHWTAILLVLYEIS